MKRESGVGGFKAILALLLLAALVFLGIKLLPPFINNYQFSDDIEAIARFGTYAQGKSEEDLRNDVLAKAKEIGVDLKPEQVQVVKSTYGVNITVNYVVVVEVPGHTFNLKFNPVAGNKMLTAK